MNGGHDLHLDLCAALAVGSIEPQDLRVLEEHLEPGCAECSAFLREACGPLEALALASPPALPSRGLKARVMVAVARPGSQRPAATDEAPPARTRRGSRLLPALPGWALTVAALLLVALGVGWWRTSVLAERVRDLEGASISALDPETEWREFLRAFPRAQVIELAVQPGADPARRARVAYDVASRRALAHFAGFEAETGADFELWTVRDGTPYSEGLVRVGRDGRGTRRIENVGDPAALKAFAVSHEQAGGSKDRRKPARVEYVGGVP